LGQSCLRRFWKFGLSCSFVNFWRAETTCTHLNLSWHLTWVGRNWTSHCQVHYLDLFCTGHWVWPWEGETRNQIQILFPGVSKPTQKARRKWQTTDLNKTGCRAESHTGYLPS
jgi:hypothetical protein